MSKYVVYDNPPSQPPPSHTAIDPSRSLTFLWLFLPCNMITERGPHLTYADTIVLRNLKDIDSKGHPDGGKSQGHGDRATIQLLDKTTDPDSDEFLGSPFSTWDERDLNTWFRAAVVQPYVAWAEGVVRRRADVVFLTHIGLYLATLIPSAFLLYYRFSWLHAPCHFLLAIYYAGPFTLLLHNHIHNNGLLTQKYAWFDYLFPYMIGPLLGHTPNSYYYHHVKHHHLEENGPDDLSSTIRYQRDELVDFLAYLGRFLAFVWIELPLYFFRRSKYALAFKCLLCEVSSMVGIIWLSKYDFRPTLFVFIIPLIQMRIFMMIGNWGQHALVDEIDPKSNYRSSITLIDVQVSLLSNDSVAVLRLEQSNRYCFNDGYHTSHHLNSRRHWRDHPASFVKAKTQYQAEGALVFHNIDYLGITYRLLRKDYDFLAKCLVPIGDQVGKSHQELASLLKKKTQRFTEEQITKIFRKA